MIVATGASFTAVMLMVAVSLPRQRAASAGMAVVVDRSVSVALAAGVSVLSL